MKPVDPTLGLRIEAVCTQFEKAWQAGTGPRIEDYLAGWTGEERSALLRELIPLDLEYRRKAGEEATLADYSRHFPGLNLEAEQPTLPPVAGVAVEQETLAPEPAGGGTSGDLLPPGYEPLGELGRGGMGVVYRARHVKLNRVCAVKMILAGGHAGQAERQRFEAEAQAIARLQHPGIVQVFEVGEHQGHAFMALEFCPGGSLDRRLRDKPPTAREAAAIVRALAEAMQAAHDENVLHRDLKPAYVLIAGDGTVKVTDFGLAKKLDEAGQTQTGAVMGTPSYMPPEQASGVRDLGPAVDVYALGAVLYECLTGRPPYRGATAMDTILQVLGDEPVAVRQLNPQASADLETICHKCLQKDAKKRYASAQELADDLGRFLDGRPITARPVSSFERGYRWVKRNPAVSALSAAVLLVLGAGVVASWILAAWALYEKGNAEVLAKAEGEANLFAQGQKKLADDKAGEARREAAAAKAQARRAEDARHAIQIDNAMRARQEGGYDRMATLLAEMLPKYHQTWETRYVRNLWLKEAWPLRVFGHFGDDAGNGNTGQVFSAVFSPDGKRVVTGSKDKTARVWDVETGQEKAVLRGHTDLVRSVAVSPDGKRILTASHDQTARVWDAETGQPKVTFLGHTAHVVGVSFSPDGTRVLTHGSDKTVRVWDAETGRELVTVKGHTHYFTSAVFSPDGKRILTASDDQTARLWDAETGRENAVLKGDAGGIESAVFSPDGKRVVTGNKDKTARVWDVETGQEKAVLRGHTDPVLRVSFSQDGRRILTASQDKTAKVWDAETGQVTATLLVGGWDGILYFSPDGKCIRAGHRLWDAQTGELKATFSSSQVARHLCFSPDNKRFLMAGPDGLVHLWDAESGLERGVLKGHTGSVVPACFSPDGQRVLTRSQDRTARVWDAATGREKAVLKGHTDHVQSASFSPNGMHILTASSDKTARLWDAETGQQLALLNGHTDQVWYACFGPDGQRVLTGSHDKTARVWDATTGRELAALTGHTGMVTSVCFSLDGTRILTGCSVGARAGGTLGEARVWDAATGKELAVLMGHAGGVYSVCFSPDGRRILTGGADRTARVWDSGTGKELAVLTGHLAGVSRACFSPDGERVLTCSFHESTPRLWDAHTGQELIALRGHTEHLSGACFSPDGTRILTGSMDRTARLWDAETGQELAVLKGHVGYVHSPCFSPDGTRIFTGSWDKTARLWDAPLGYELAVLKGHTGGIYSVSFSPDGKRLLTGCERPDGFTVGKDKDRTVRVWDAQTGLEMAVLKGHTHYVVSSSFSPDTRRVLTCSLDKTARVWDAATGKELAVLKGHAGSVSCACFSPDGKRILTGDWGVNNEAKSIPGEAKVWDAATGEELSVLKGGAVRSAFFSPDGTRVLTSNDGQARVWDPQTGREVVIKGPLSESPRMCFGFSPDGKRILTASEDKAARVRDAETGQEKAVLKGHNYGITSACFSPDGKYVLTASEDKTARVWDAATGKELAVLLGHTSRVCCACYSPDGKRILTAGEDKTARVWDAATGKELAVLRGHAGEVWSACFSPDGKRVATGSEDGTVRLWAPEVGRR